MKTSPDCRACFLKQAHYTSHLTSASEQQLAEISRKVPLLLDRSDPALPPPVNAIPMYEMIAELSGTPDPFHQLKKQSNQLALAEKETIQALITASPDPLFSAILFAIAGNVIDYGSRQEFNLQQTLAECQNKPLAINDYRLLQEDLHQAKHLLYLGDNCGEIVFDSLLMAQLTCRVTLALKERPIINDALPVDAASCGIDMSCVISNGTGCPGTPLDLCSPEFRALFDRADIILSKGQGNFETLSECHRPVYFLFTVKCQVVAHHATQVAGIQKNLQIGDPVLMKLPMG